MVALVVALADAGGLDGVEAREGFDQDALVGAEAFHGRAELVRGRGHIHRCDLAGDVAW